MPLTDKLREEYARLYKALSIRKARQAQIDANIKTILAGQARYETVSKATHVPWYVIGVIHLLECDSRFDCHLHNGDQLWKRTVHVPKGRPVTGMPPFTWEYSAQDALEFEGLNFWTDWGVAGTLYKLEAYNGFGTRNHGVPTPYLWGGTTYYNRGKYVKDGVWSPVTISTQIGAAPILKLMANQKLITFPPVYPAIMPCQID